MFLSAISSRSLVETVIKFVVYRQHEPAYKDVCTYLRDDLMDNLMDNRKDVLTSQQKVLSGSNKLAI